MQLSVLDGCGCYMPVSKSYQAERQCSHHVQVYYGAWRGCEVAVKVMSADITQHVCCRLGGEALQQPSRDVLTHCRLYRRHFTLAGIAVVLAPQKLRRLQLYLWCFDC